MKRKEQPIFTKRDNLEFFLIRDANPSKYFKTKETDPESPHLMVNAYALNLYRPELEFDKPFRPLVTYRINLAIYRNLGYETASPQLMGSVIIPYIFKHKKHFTKTISNMRSVAEYLLDEREIKDDCIPFRVWKSKKIDFINPNYYRVSTGVRPIKLISDREFLSLKLEHSIQQEEYEEAAKIRDKLNKL